MYDLLLSICFNKKSRSLMIKTKLTDRQARLRSMFTEFFYMNSNPGAHKVFSMIGEAFSIQKICKQITGNMGYGSIGVSFLSIFVEF